MLIAHGLLLQATTCFFKIFCFLPLQAPYLLKINRHEKIHADPDKYPGPMFTFSRTVTSKET